MRLSAFILLVCGAAGLCPPATCQASADPGGRDLTRAEAARVMNFVFEGKTRLAFEYLEEVAGECGGQPFYLLIKSRVARETLTVDDENKEQVERDAGPIHRDLDRVIEVCSKRMDGGDADPELLFFRGLAWMSKSHLDSFARQFWRAGREAKKGRSDLEAYLESQPDDPVAKGTLGVFLYFADTIPSVFKYLSKVLLLPTGDRDKGLDYIRYAAEQPSFMQPEFAGVLGTIYVLFEGRYEDGIERTSALLERYPANPRIALPLALILPFAPADITRIAALLDDTVDRTADLPPDAPERYSTTLVKFLLA